MKIFDRLWAFKNNDYLFQNKVTAVLLKDVETYEGQNEDGTEQTGVIPAGTRVRFWMVSRFGDAGITPNLGDDCHGYDARVGSHVGRVEEVRNPGTLEDYFGSVSDLDGLPDA